MGSQTRKDIVYLALGGTPLLYASHTMINSFLGLEEAHPLVEQTERTNEGRVF